MTNKTILEKLISDINNSSMNRGDFALHFIDVIESLDDIPFSLIDEARDWQYKLETEGDTFKAVSSFQNNKALIAWVNRLIRAYA